LRQQLPDLSRRYPSDDERIYLRTHRLRYDLLVELVAELRPERVLVVGPSFETVLLREALPAVAVNTAGWHDHRFPLREGESHVQVDLNDPERPPLEEHDVVVCSEVIEHLHVAPVPVVRYLASALRPGGRLILQTPNATALPKRLRMAVGRNPYDLIRDEPGNPGHFHEFTVPELLGVVEAAGLEVDRWLTRSYFDHGSRKNRLYRAASSVLPRTLREGITVVARRGR
jgi:SAM-dependent methyltransferase